MLKFSHCKGTGTGTHKHYMYIYVPATVPGKVHATVLGKVQNGLVSHWSQSWSNSPCSVKTSTLETVRANCHGPGPGPGPGPVQVLCK